MSAIAIDTQRVAQRLQESGFSRKQAATPGKLKRAPRPPALKKEREESALIFDPQATTERTLAVMEWVISSGRAKDDREFGRSIGMSGNTIYHYNKTFRDGGRVIGPEYAATIKVRYNVPSDYIYCNDTHNIPDEFRAFLSSRMLARNIASG